jgi:hypothetical protein
MAAFVTRCEASMGIEPHLNLWKYLFHAQLYALGMEAVALGNVDIFVQSFTSHRPILQMGCKKYVSF